MYVWLNSCCYQQPLNEWHEKVCYLEPIASLEACLHYQILERGGVGVEWKIEQLTLCSPVSASFFHGAWEGEEWKIEQLTL